MPLLLALNTAEQRVQFALAETYPGQAASLLVSQSWQVKSGGTELLTPALGMALRRLKLHVQDINRIAVVVGPGNFTGLRLGMVTAAGLARAHAKSAQEGQGATAKALQAPLDYTHLLAFSAHRFCAFPEGTRIGVLTHARKNITHYGFFVVENAIVRQAAACQELSLSPAILDTQAALPLAAADVLLGSGLSKNQEFFSSQPFRARFLPQQFDNPTADALLTLAEQAVYAAEDPKPLYVRDCDAVENLPDISCALGQDPEKARAEYERLTTI